MSQSENPSFPESPQPVTLQELQASLQCGRRDFVFVQPIAAQIPAKKDQQLSQNCLHESRWASFPWKLGALGPHLVEWVDPRAIISKLPSAVAQQLVTNRSWPFVENFNVERYDNTAKFVSIQSRMLEDCPWERTPIFEVYRDRIQRGEEVKGYRDIQSLAEAYETRFTELLRSMSKGGFSRTQLGVRPQDLPWAVRLRGGSLWFGNQGNHRLSIAKVIGLPAFPVFARFHHCAGLKSNRLQDQPEALG